MGWMQQLAEFLKDPYYRKTFFEMWVKRCYIGEDSIGEKPLQNVHTPYSLCKEMVGKLKENVDLKCNIVLALNIEFISELLEAKELYFVSDSKEKTKLVQCCYPSVKILTGDFLGEKNMGRKFDIIVQNPPFQCQNPGEKKTHPLWHKFVEKAISLLNKDGYLACVHPSGWRNVDGRFKDVQELLKSKQMSYLEMHHFREGQQIFNASIDFDWYILKNTDNNGELTTIKFQDGSVEEVDISKIEFLPNNNYKEVDNLIAKDGEEKVTILNNSSYHHQREYMSKKQSKRYTHPCIYTVATDNQPTFYWSKTNNKGHFRIPKVIWASGMSGIVVDTRGRYALTEYASAIVDKPENLENIKKAMQTERFVKEIMGFKHSLGDKYNRKVIAMFRKDFWRKFI
jgi:23S rRNA G2069 N7-methylase RlmK/C1962 C5-methylase RlmI